MAALACALLIVPAAGADGGVSYTIVSGVTGDNGWYRSVVKVHITATDPTTCPTNPTFSTSSSQVDCTWGTENVPFHLQFNIDPDAPTVTGETADRAPDKKWLVHAPVDCHVRR